MRVGLWRVAPLWIAGACLVGCGGGGRGVDEPTQTLTGRVTYTDFVVGADERIACSGDVTIACRTATINGRLYSLPGSAAGSAGASLTIEAEQELTVTGSVAAGDGQPGGADGGGGDGGTLRLVSAHGGLTLGASPTARQAGDQPILAAGEGGNGGNGDWGGAGGHGGKIVLECPDGVLDLQLQAALVHPGNGGRGGTGATYGEAMGDYPTEGDLALTNRGGNGGTVEFTCNELLGVELTATDETHDGLPVRIAEVDAAVWSGGNGGDAGDYYLGVDPGTGEASHPAPASRQDDQSWRWMRSNIVLTGQDGGNGFPNSGSGGDLTVDLNESIPPGQGGDGATVVLEAGNGGEVTLNDTFVGTVSHVWLRFLPRQQINLGHGGNAQAHGGNGAPGPAGGKGGNGGNANARGGKAGGWFGGGVLDWTVTSTSGRGGHGLGTGGNGGQGGNAPDEGQPPGGAGGDGGRGTGVGGNGNVLNDGWGTPGGDGRGRGGNGGNGGNSYGQPGSGGDYGGAFGWPGFGTPNGQDETRYGGAGQNGRRLPSQPPEGTSVFTAVLRRVTDTEGVGLAPELFTTHGHRALSLLGGPNNPLLPALGQSMAASEDGLDVYFCSTAGDGVRRYHDTGAGGDVPPDLRLSPNGTSQTFLPVALWLDTGRDTLYCVSGSAVLLAWERVSEITTNRAPDRSCQLTDAGTGLTGITGDSRTDRLFLCDGSTRVGVVDLASGRNGATRFDRVITGALQGASGLAYDAVHDLLFVPRVDLAGGQHGVGLVANAGLANGAVTPTLLTGPSTGLTAPSGSPEVNRPVALCSFGEENLLFVQAAEGRLLMFSQASTLSGDDAPLNIQELNGGVAALVYVQRQ